MGAGSFLIVNRTHPDGNKSARSSGLARGNKFELVAKMWDDPRQNLAGRRQLHARGHIKSWMAQPPIG